MPLLEVEHLTGGYTKRPVLKNISFKIEEKTNYRTYWIKWSW
ncbi:ABC transporter ATP-binding protein [Listeria fleischmannii FSL S10-1203]|uniref:ABC transporter ATP-binding protein n=1 Tax=Listeria fleischmannii FSL S10-1203 TaxID=1265822 RepID=W7DZP3_9LIST|nr:ABC transporter ATP-binding protein [Listeria fleischmannii FSL S10-1203]